MELMQIMMSKIKRTEAKCAALEKECYSKVIFYIISIFLNKIVKLLTHQCKDKRIQILEEKLKICQKINEESNDELVEELELNNLSLREKIYEMEVNINSIITFSNIFKNLIFLRNFLLNMV